MKINARLLDGVSETLLLTLYLRFRESKRPDGKLSDKYYDYLVGSLDYDFSVFDEIPDDIQLSIVCRCIIFDNLAKQFIARHTNGIIVSFGPGLDFRHIRLDNGAILWIDVDLPEVTKIRKVFFPEDRRHRLLGLSALDSSWMNEIPGGRPVFFIAEGLLVYFTPLQVRTILSNISRNFPKSEMILDVYSNWYVNSAKNSSPYAFLNRMYGLWQWGMDDWSEIESFDPGIRLVEEYYQYHGFGDRMPYALKTALSEENVYTESEREIMCMMSRIGHIRLGC